MTRSEYAALAQSAHRIVRKAISVGELPRAKTLLCVVCNSNATVYDHRDYSKPLMVQPMCQSCNKNCGHAINWLGISVRELSNKCRGDSKMFKSVDVTPDIWRKFRAQCVLVGKSTGEVLDELMKLWVEKKK